MVKPMEAVYENGVFRPLQPVDLAEQQRVTVTVDNEGLQANESACFTLSPERWQEFCDALDAPPRPIPALRKLLTEQGLFDAAGTAGHAR